MGYKAAAQGVGANGARAYVSTSACRPYYRRSRLNKHQITNHWVTGVTSQSVRSESTTSSNRPGNFSEINRHTPGFFRNKNEETGTRYQAPFSNNTVNVKVKAAGLLHRAGGLRRDNKLSRRRAWG